MISEVKDSSKIVTDTLVLKRLAEQGIDPKFVEFWHDYAPRSRGKEYSPYAKFYRDLKSNNRFMVVSGLPMVKPDGQKIEVGWTKQDNKYYSKANLFLAIVEGKQVQVTCLSDQPTGAKKDDRVTYKPQLFLDGIEIVNGSQPRLLPVDPTNPNYHQNTLEWDYGICKRRIRIIEGRFRDRIFLTSDPRGEVRVANNVSGNLPLRFGSRDADGMPIGRVEGDVEIISAEELAKATYPIQIGASPETFYPDPHDENTSVDGWVQHWGSGLSWADVRGGEGTSASDDTGECETLLDSDPTAWDGIRRSIILFDTSGLPDAATITAITLSLYGSTKTQTAAWAADINIYSSAPASNIALEAGDFNSLGTEALATAITYVAFTTSGYNVFTLIDVNSDDFATNADGTYINKTGVTKLGARNANYDVANIEPDWAADRESKLHSHSAEQGTGFKPKLVVTYIIVTVPTVTTQAVTDIGID